MKASKTFTTTAAAVALVSAIGLAYAQSGEEPIQPQTAAMTEQAQMPAETSPATTDAAQPMTAAQQQQQTQDGQAATAQRATQTAAPPLMEQAAPQMQTQMQAQTPGQTPMTSTTPATPATPDPSYGQSAQIATPAAAPQIEPTAPLLERAARPDRN